MNDDVSKSGMMPVLGSSADNAAASVRDEHHYYNNLLTSLVTKLTDKPAFYQKFQDEELITIKVSLKGTNFPEAVRLLKETFGDGNVGIMSQKHLCIRPQAVAEYCELNQGFIPIALQEKISHALENQEELQRARKAVAAWQENVNRFKNPPDIAALFADDDDLGNLDFDVENPFLENGPSTSRDEQHTAFEHVSLYQQHIQALKDITGEAWQRTEISGQPVYRLVLPHDAPDSQRQKCFAMVREIVKHHATIENDQIILPESAVLDHYLPKAATFKALNDITGVRWKTAKARVKEDGFVQDVEAYTPIPTKAYLAKQAEILGTLRDNFITGVTATEKGVVVTQKSIDHYLDMLKLGKGLERLTGKTWKHFLAKNTEGKRKDAFYLELGEDRVLANRDRALDTLKDALRMDVFDHGNQGDQDRIIVWAEAVNEYCKHNPSLLNEWLTVRRPALAGDFADIPLHGHNATTGHTSRISAEARPARAAGM